MRLHTISTGVLSLVVAVAVALAGGSGQVAQARAAADGQTPPILTAFVKAYASGEYKNVRALFTKDGVFTTVSNVHGQLYHKKVDEPGVVDTPSFRDLASIHLGSQMKVVGTPIRVGDNTLAFGWKWPDGTTGTGMFHLRNGKIVFAIVQPMQYPLPFGG